MAFAIAIALHEIVAGLIPSMPSSSVPRSEIVSRTQIVRVTVRVTPTPTPSPARTPALLVRTVSERLVAAPRRADAGLGASIGRAHALHPHAMFANSKPVWDMSATTPGSGTITAAAGNGIGASGGNGSGANSTAGASDNGPCGFVTFSDPHGSQFDTQTKGFWVDIRMSVHFANGTSQSMILDYPWYYAHEAANPWSDQNLKDPAFPTRFQSPPAAKLASEPELVKYVAAHSTADGVTLLRDCADR